MNTLSIESPNLPADPSLDLPRGGNPRTTTRFDRSLAGSLAIALLACVSFAGLVLAGPPALAREEASAAAAHIDALSQRICVATPAAGAAT